MAENAEPGPSRGTRSRSRWLLAGLLLVAALTVAALLIARRTLNAPVAAAKTLTFSVVRGERMDQVLADLRDAGALSWRQALVLGLYARYSGAAEKIKAGEYQIGPADDGLELLQRIVAGHVLMHELRLTDGWRFAQAWQAIVADPDLRHTLPADADGATIMRALGHPDVAAEGEFFPDTYRFARGETDLQFLRHAYQQMQDRLQAVWAARAAKLPLTSAYQALILASLVEKETALASERPRIAGVFKRRLQIGMRLQTDPSVIYGMGDAYKGDIHSRDLTTDTPYNTYTRSGLPPTPICLPGQAALSAAVHPADGTSLYFVAKGDGSHAFAATLAEHDANVRRYQLGGK